MRGVRAGEVLNIICGVSCKQTSSAFEEQHELRCADIFYHYECWIALEKAQNTLYQDKSEYNCTAADVSVYSRHVPAPPKRSMTKIHHWCLRCNFYIYCWKANPPPHTHSSMGEKNAVDSSSLPRREFMLFTAIGSILESESNRGRVQNYRKLGLRRCARSPRECFWRHAVKV